ncbi:MAG: cupin domain-containing protein [Bacteroidota bacterium]|nr:cupin domain-containing protein [Bacteroidota bacterium]
MEAEKYIAMLELQPHPEGGWYREVYRSADQHQVVGIDFPSGRNFCTSIYFMITQGNFSAFHRIKSDETWHFYAGDPLEVIELDAAGNIKKILIGSDPGSGNFFQYTVPAGTWFASRVSNSGEFSLVGCTVAPGFDFRDFEIADRKLLLEEFPVHSEIIKQLTRI